MTFVNFAGGQIRAMGRRRKLASFEIALLFSTVVHALPLPLALLANLDFTFISQYTYDGQLFCWENKEAARRLIVNTATQLIYFNKILRSGKSKQLAYSHLPQSAAEFESQLQAIGWL